jgi:hypothetical protein
VRGFQALRSRLRRRSRRAPSGLALARASSSAGCLIFGGLLAGGLLTGCLLGIPPDYVGPNDEGTQFVLVEPAIDVLVVIDNSASTTDKQAAFAASVPRLVQALDAFPTGRPSLHIGVVSTSVNIGVSYPGAVGCFPAENDDGRLHNQPGVMGCPVPRDRYISDVTMPGGGRSTNYTGMLSDTLSCISQLGAMGCGFEAPLESIKRALDGSRPENAGFLRPGAALAVVVLTDEDDCSVQDPELYALPMSVAGQGSFRCQPLHAYECDTPISIDVPGSYHNCRIRTGSYLADTLSYHQLLTELRPHGAVAVAVIGGDPATDISTGTLLANPLLELLPSCMATINGNLAIARPGIRIADFVSRFGDHGLYRSVCQPDYSAVFTEIGGLLSRVTSSCLDGELELDDTDRNNAGTQLDCNIAEETAGDTPQQVVTTIPACAMTDGETPSPDGARPCWWTRADAACTTPSGLTLRVERAVPPPADAKVRVRCAKAR